MVIPLRDHNPTRTRPVLTLLIVAANVAIFFLVQPAGFRSFNETSLQSTNEADRFLYEHALVPCELSHREALSPRLEAQCGGRASFAPLVPAQPYFPGKSILLSVLASMFLHGSLLHLGGNMLYLWIFGNNVEDRLGRVGFLLFYLLAGVVASLVHVAVDPSSLAPVIGASGAIAGVMGAYLVWYPRARILSIVPIFFFIQFVELPASLVLVLWFVLQFFTNPNSGVAWAAHVGGFVAGALVALAVGRGGPRRAATDYDWR